MPASGNTQTPGTGQRRLGRGRRPRSEAVLHSPPDAGVLAREAVISFLREASTATAERTVERAAEHAGAVAIPQDTISAATTVAVEPEAWTLAAISAAALDRIEAAAAKVEADIAVAHRAYEKLQAGAGAAAEAAVRAAQSAMGSAGVAVEAERQIRISLRQVRQNVVISAGLVVVVIIALLVVSSVVH